MLRQKNKTMEHSMSLKYMIYYVVIISIFGFKKYWEQVFNFIDIKTMPTSKQFLQSETLNAKKSRTINYTM